MSGTRRLQIIVIALVMAAMALYFVVYALQRYAVGDQSLVCLIAFLIVAVPLALRLMGFAFVGRRFVRGARRGFMSGYRRDQSD